MPPLILLALIQHLVHIGQIVNVVCPIAKLVIRTKWRLA